MCKIKGFVVSVTLSFKFDCNSAAFIIAVHLIQCFNKKSTLIENKMIVREDYGNKDVCNCRSNEWRLKRGFVDFVSEKCTGQSTASPTTCKGQPTKISL